MAKRTQSIGEAGIACKFELVHTLDRFEILKETLSLLMKHGFYEIIVVDFSGLVDARKNRELRQKLGVTYCDMVGNREVARNFGARRTEGD